MNTHSLTQNNSLLKFLEFLKTHCSRTSKPLQDDSFNQENRRNSSSAQHMQALRQLQQTYYLERRCFF